MARIYVASSWRNEYQPSVVAELRSAGHEVYDFREGKSFRWEEIDPEWKAWAAGQYRTMLVAHPRAAQGFLNDFRAMMWADTCVLVLPSGRSAHLEAGWFCGANKRCFILTRDGEEPELMNLMATDICLSVAEILYRLGRP